MMVRLGSEKLIAGGTLKNKRVGVVSNPASIDARFQHIVDTFATSKDVKLAAIFGPQHGFRSDVQDNMIETSHNRDARRGVPVYSLYSETREPTAEMLRGLDALVIDLQDIGARIYTYIYTMANCLRACGRHGVAVIVCDRPNPINGVDVEGNLLRKGFESFVGLFPLPMRHGMTIAELARLFNEEFGLGAQLEVIRMEGWQRSEFHDATDLPWVMPSPNIPTLDSAVVYPGTVLFEGTLLSEGRGTTRPFELVGAPGIEAERFAGHLNELGLPGVFFRPAVFEPTFQKHAKQPCGGCQVHVTDRRTFKPVLTGVALLAAFWQARGTALPLWRQPPYEYEHEKLPIDILSGSDALRTQIESGMGAAAIGATWQGEEGAFRKARAPYLLYP